MLLTYVSVLLFIVSLAEFLPNEYRKFKAIEKDIFKVCMIIIITIVINNQLFYSIGT